MKAHGKHVLIAALVLLIVGGVGLTLTAQDWLPVEAVLYDVWDSTNHTIQIEISQESVTGNMAVGGNLTVTGTSEFNDDITLENDETISNSVNGTIAITSPAVTFSGTIATTGAVDFGGDLTLENDETISNSADGTIAFTSPAATFSGTVATTGAVDFGGDITLENDETISNSSDGTIDLTGDVDVNGALQVVDGTTGGLNLHAVEATATLTGASTDIDINVPSGALIVGAQLRVDTAITSGDGAASWTAAYKTGATATIATAQAFTKNTKVNAFFDANAATAITSDVTDITITPDANTFSGGVVRAIVYYYSFTTMADAS